MKKLLLYLQNHQTTIAGLILFAVSTAIVVYISPREAKFKYEFQKGKPWLYSDLVAPFDFPILKSEEELEAERQSYRENKTIFLTKNTSVAENALVQFENDFEKKWRIWNLSDPPDSLKAKLPRELWQEGKKQELVNSGRNLLGSLYDKGILQPFEVNEDNVGEVLLKQQGVSKPVNLASFLSISEAGSRIRETLTSRPDTVQDFMLPLLLDHIQHNVFYNEEMTRNYLESQLNDILPTYGKVQKGELIIVKGNIIDDQKHRKLESLRQSYEGSYAGRNNFLLVLFGQILQVGLLFAVLYIFLQQFRKELMEDVSKITFVLANVLVAITLVRIVMDFGLQYIYLIPLTILPITLRSFFDTRLALFVHTVAVLLSGFFVPNAFQFVFLQFTAGVFSVVMVTNLYKRNQLFVTAAKIIGVYCLAYLSIAIIQEGSFEQLNYVNFAFFAGNGFLTLMSFPLIYFQEKIFGFVSDVSLLELSDTNNPLLRELGQKAPGTFQHSLQVANLAEAAILKIGGNALLVRTGALYHDIGKMINPLYFIENQSTGLNPHDELSFQESAEIIINHVKQGIRLAKRNNLPDTIIDFIRTHHGTTTVMYFYRQYIKNFPEQEVDLAKFTYPGPKPFSKETAALMMADSVEAASRSIDKPDHEKIDKLVEGIIDHQMKSDQFENANITLKEIKDIKKIFKKMLMNIYHVRVQYPE